MDHPLVLLVQDFSSLFDSSALRDLQVGTTLLNLVLALVLGQILSIHYQNFARVLSNKRKFAPILVYIAATTMLVISVVKTSLALSLGLVGALSIIRFRTPIKEPEELAYLFMAVAIGVGMGADQRIATAIMVLGILAYMSLVGRGKQSPVGARTLVHVGCELGERDRTGAIEALLGAVQPHAVDVDLRRIDIQEEAFEASLIVDLGDSSKLGGLLDSVQGAFPGASVSVVEADGLD
ncbi:MAG: DUF4956 domain-containing protein [Planctomycetota bacterium]|nr:DUF4956 domain-containing protein [Planctomycetota bacterium]